MPVIRSFRDLVGYQKSREAAKQVFCLTKHFPKEERYSPTDQIRRSSRAVGAMISEAWARRRYIAAWENKLSEALAEASETQAWLDSALDSEYVTEAEHRQFDRRYQEIGAILHALIEKSDTFCEPIRRR